MTKREFYRELNRLKIAADSQPELQAALADLQLHREELRSQAQQLLLTREELERSLRRYTDLFENAPVGYIVMDANGVVRDLNFAASELLGVERGKACGYPMVPWVAASSRRAFLDHLWTCRHSTGRVSVELELHTRDGRRVHIRMITDARVSVGQPSYQSALIDLSTEQALRDSQEQLRRAERLAAIGTLAAGIAHEINNPLNSIHMATEFALHAEEPGPVTGTLQSILEQTKRCAQIVRGILSFARQQDAPRRLTDTYRLLRRVAELARDEIASPDVRIEVTESKSPPMVRISETGIEQVLLNLIRNAAQAGRGPLRIVLSTTEADGEVQLVVEDDGPGISAEALPHIFDPFYTTRVNRGGTGLGLTICHRIVRDHGGTIQVHSVPGQGTRFTISLPAPRPEALYGLITADDQREKTGHKAAAIG